jgi:hypothetical protein
VLRQTDGNNISLQLVSSAFLKPRQLKNDYQFNLIDIVEKHLNNLQDFELIQFIPLFAVIVLIETTALFLSSIPKFNC